MGPHGRLFGKGTRNVCFGSKAVVPARSAQCLLCANSGHLRERKAPFAIELKIQKKIGMT